MKNHGLRMVIGCVLPLLLIFALPAFGVSSSMSLFIFIILMFGCHLFMMGGHHGHNAGGHKHNDEKGGMHGSH